MKRIFKLLIVIIFLLVIPIEVNAKENTKIYFFYSNTCPHCKAEGKFLDEIEEKNKDIEVIKYEVTTSEDNKELMNKYIKDLQIERTVQVPFTVIGKNYTIGYSSVIKDRIENFIEDENTTEYDIPILGKVDAKKVSLPLASAVIGFVDGFNPCAMWVLLFLISMLLGMKDRKRMWIIGITFLLTSALVYMGILLSWIKIVDTVSTSKIFQILIALVALIGGFINLRNYKKEQDSGCTVVDQKKRTKIFKKIKNFTGEKSLLLALLGVIGLAISVNLVELACSAGFPLIYTGILDINNVSTIEAAFYTFIYILFFLLDDLIIFIIAMTTMKATGISTKYNKYSHLVGGILMILIGIIMILKPEWLMFNF